MASRPVAENDELTLFAQRSQLEGAFLNSYARHRKVSQVCSWIYQVVLWSALGIIGFHLWNHHALVQGDSSLGLERRSTLTGFPVPLQPFQDK